MMIKRHADLGAVRQADTNQAGIKQIVDKVGSRSIRVGDINSTFA